MLVASMQVLIRYEDLPRSSLILLTRPFRRGHVPNEADELSIVEGHVCHPVRSPPIDVHSLTKWSPNMGRRRYNARMPFK